MATLRASGLDEYSGAELVAATNSGETHAFEKLVFRCKRSVFAAAQRITNTREDAEDVVQESFHKAFLHLVSRKFNAVALSKFVSQKKKRSLTKEKVKT